jgi:hypothetical protein
MYTADKKKYIIACATSSAHSNKSRAEMSQSGLVDGHAYSLISADEYDFGTKKVRLIKVRNPYGLKEWSGAWSDNS